MGESTKKQGVSGKTAPEISPSNVNKKGRLQTGIYRPKTSDVCYAIFHVSFPLISASRLPFPRVLIASSTCIFRRSS